MNIIQVDQALAPAGLRAPRLAALIPDINTYSVLLAQPQGSIAADAVGVRNRDPARAQTVFTQFIEKAIATNADIAVTPEYSLPWSTLVAALKAGRQPSNGKLWAFGCESITRVELTAHRTSRHDIADIIGNRPHGWGTRFL